MNTDAPWPDLYETEARVLKIQTMAPDTGGAEAVPPGCREVQRTAIPAIHHGSQPVALLEGVPPLVSAFVHLSVLLAEPEPSGGPCSFRRCRGCSRLSPRLRSQAAPSLSDLLRQVAGGDLPPTRSCGTSWRTQP